MVARVRHHKLSKNFCLKEAQNRTRSRSKPQDSSLFCLFRSDGVFGRVQERACCDADAVGGAIVAHSQAVAFSESQGAHRMCETFLPSFFCSPFSYPSLHIARKNSMPPAVVGSLSSVRANALAAADEADSERNFVTERETDTVTG